MGRRPDHLSLRRLIAARAADLTEQALLAGLSADELAELASSGTVAQLSTRASGSSPRRQRPTSLFFLQSGMVSVKLPSGVRLATLEQGMGSAKWRCSRAAHRRRLRRHRRRLPRTAARGPGFARRRAAAQAVAQPVVAAGSAPDPRQRESRAADRLLRRDATSVWTDLAAALFDAAIQSARFHTRVTPPRP